MEYELIFWSTEADDWVLLGHSLSLNRALYLLQREIVRGRSADYVRIVESGFVQRRIDQAASSEVCRT